MRILVAVGSEEQINTGAAWCASIDGVTAENLELAILGVDRKALAEYGRKTLATELNCNPADLNVTTIEADANAILTHAENQHCRSLILLHNGNLSDLHKEVFQTSKHPTLWLRIIGKPPSSESQIVSAFHKPSRVTSVVTEKLLGFAPGKTLCSHVDLQRDNLSEAIKTALSEDKITDDELLLFGIDDPDSSDRVYKTALLLIDSKTTTSIGLLHDGYTLPEKIASQVYQWAADVAPPMDRQERIDLSQDLQSGSAPNLEFFGLISAAAMLAAFGLIQDSAAVIIGAMLIAPLMTPIIGAGLALAQGNRPLFRSAATTIILGFLCALLASMLFGWLVLIFQEPVMTSEMRARCSPSPIDFCVGLVGGFAATYARTRRHLSAALAGAAIAAALVPPISTAGLQLAFHVWTWDANPVGVPILGPILLVLVNVLMIMGGSAFVLWARGMRTDRTLTIQDRWTVRIAAFLFTITLLILTWLLLPHTSQAGGPSKSQNNSSSTQNVTDDTNVSTTDSP
ncbi:MAG: DUF389 domain-containing protein [Rubripirellula sp.]